MELKAVSNARVLVATDGSNALFIDLGNVVVPVSTGYNGVDVNEPGGYYIPEVDAETGYVSWTPSRPDMPAIEATNIRGPEGPAGRGVFGLNLKVDETGAVTGGTVYYSDGDISNITIAMS